MTPLRPGERPCRASATFRETPHLIRYRTCMLAAGHRGEHAALIDGAIHTWENT